MIVVKDRKRVSFLKSKPFIPTGSTNDFLLFDPLIDSFCFCPACADKSGDFSPFHSIVCVHPPPTYSLRASASFNDRLALKIANDLPIFASYYALLCICILFLSPDWLIFCHMINTHINSLVFLKFIFCLSLTMGHRNVRLTIRIGSTPTFAYFDL